MLLISHRGLQTRYIKENTLEAFYNAINNNYDGIELDIRQTKDNKIVIIHDKYINRTSNGFGNINNFKYNELLKYNFGSNNVKSIIPTLYKVLKNIKYKIIFIEIKEQININKLNNILNKFNKNIYYIMSLNYKYIENIKNYKIGIIYPFYNYLDKINNIDFIVIPDYLYNKNKNNKIMKMNKELVLYTLSRKNNLKDKKIDKNMKYIL